MIKWAELECITIFNKICAVFLVYHYLGELVKKKESHVNTRVGTDHHQLIIIMHLYSASIQ